VIGELENDLPDVFSLHAVKPEPKPSADGDTGAVPEFVATLSTDGQLQLKGRVTDEQERAVTVSFAGARFGVDKVHPAMRVDANLPHGWSLRTLAGLEALSHLSSGIVVVQPDVVDVTGATGDKGASAEISRVLAAKLGEAQDYRVNVQYKEELDPVASQPTPQECAAQVNAAMKDNKITFSPGSAEIEAASADTIDKIAKILKSCPDVAMEVSGYTDSQGREEMNKALSQRRADAVLSALLARRVLTTNLTAHGYGEANPIADNSTEAGREANRRIEFRLIGQPDGEGAPTDGSAADTAGGTESGAASSDTSAPPTEATAPPPRPGDTTAADTAASDSTASADATAADTTDSTDAKDAPATADAAAPETTADITAGDGTDSTAEPSTDAAAENSPAADTAPPDTTTETAAAPAADAAAADNADTPPVVVDPDLAGKRPKPRPTR
jgi:OOP family OmpA-OmpF porin